MTPEEFAIHIRRACEVFAGSITSGHRTEARNKAVGGAADSQHLGWKAVDIVLDDWSRKDACVTFLKHCGLRVIDEVTTKNHLHVDDKNDA